MWHVFPINDLKEHTLNENCDCNPIAYLLNNGNIMYVHNSYDGREYIEKLFVAFNKN